MYECMCVCVCVRVCVAVLSVCAYTQYEVVCSYSSYI